MTFNNISCDIISAICWQVSVTCGHIWRLCVMLCHHLPTDVNNSIGLIVRRVFHLSLHLITFAGRSTHLAYLVDKSGCKTAAFTFFMPGHIFCWQMLTLLSLVIWTFVDSCCHLETAVLLMEMMTHHLLDDPVALWIEYYTGNLQNVPMAQWLQ